MTNMTPKHCSKELRLAATTYITPTRSLYFQLGCPNKYTRTQRVPLPSRDRPHVTTMLPPSGLTTLVVSLGTPWWEVLHDNDDDTDVTLLDLSTFCCAA